MIYYIQYEKVVIEKDNFGNEVSRSLQGFGGYFLEKDIIKIEKNTVYLAPEGTPPLKGVKKIESV